MRWFQISGRKRLADIIVPMDEPHYRGHRARLRQRFRKTGMESFQDYEALELLLTYAVPRRDVKPLAKRLIKRFGSLQGVLDATFEELLEEDGLTENSATYIKVLKDCSALYLRGRSRRQGDIIASTGALLDYCRVKLAGLKDERFLAVFLNSSNEVIADEVIQEGTVNQSVVYPRKVMERALHHGATALIFVHNHPGGACRPSKDDKLITAELVRVAKGLQITVHDHLIVCRDGYYSFRERGQL
ncbi:MAG: DNA repair protein RadC [Thermodesulfovibrionales bacterium]|nr:DNA repair protein RadC [Thermodesulfovibrionales bacterium]